MALEQKSPNNYNFGLISNLKAQGFTKQAISLYLANLNLNEEDLQDPDPAPPIGSQRTRSYLISQKTNTVLNSIDDEAVARNQGAIPADSDENGDNTKLRGVTIFNWDSSIRNDIADFDLSKTLYCEISRFSISRGKIFNKSNVQGAVASIKEFTGLQDYSITVSGTFFTKAPDVRPARSVKRLIEMTKDIKSPRIEIINDWLNNEVGIYDMILESFSMEQSDIGNLQSFTLKGVSDLPDPQVNT